MSKHLDNEYVNNVILLMNKAIADEVLAWYQYSAGAYYLEGFMRPDVEKEFLEHAEDEKKHMYMLMERIQELNGYPLADFDKIMKITNCGYISPSVNKDTLLLIQDNIKAEECAIEVYKQIADLALEFKDHKTYDIIKYILSEEENHRTELEMLMKDYAKLVKRLKTSL